MFIRGETLSAHSACQRKIPGWIVLVCENDSVNKQACRKLTIEIVLSGVLSVFFFKFHIWLLWLSSKELKIIQYDLGRKSSGE